MHKVDHPQYHPVKFKALKPRERKTVNDTKQQWRGGAKVRQ
jgi:hypothetical protein